jgi:hypothetical protein
LAFADDNGQPIKPAPTPITPYQEPGMSGYGGALPPGYGQGGYVDQSGNNVPYSSDPGTYQQVVNTLGGGTSNGSGSSTSPFNSDPGYAQALAQQNLGIGSINNALNNQIAQRIAAYGDPALASMAGFGLDPQGAAFARQNYLSGNAELARIDKAHSQARQAIINRLAGHGLLTSGETGYENGLEDQGYGNTVYDAQQRALGDILGYRNQANSQIEGLRSQTLAALQQAYQNYVNSPGLYGTGTSANAPQAPQQSSAVQQVVKRLSTPPAKTSVKPPRLSNPYTTGQKRYG